ncbi:MAG: DNA methyltransferase [Spirochaetia bacterium]
MSQKAEPLVLRDRLAMARELLADSGSIFVQISDENLHLLRSLMDEIFGQDNSVAVIAFKKTGYQAAKLLPSNYDYLLFYAKNIKQIKYRQLYIPKLESSAFIGQDLWCDDENKLRRRLSSEEVEQLEKTAERVSVFRHKLAEGAGGSGNVEPFEWEGRLFRPKDGKHFSTTPEGMKRLSRANRLIGFGKSLRFVNFLGDHSVTPVTTTWPDTVVSGFSDPQLYVVQTATKAVERCLLMTTDPGDLVLDPTCGGGTTAYVAEQWGRRWITCDSSRVALALAKHRLMTAKFDYYRLRPLSAEDVARNPNGGWLTDPTQNIHGKATFQCETVPHIMLKNISRNTSLDPIFAKHEPILAEKLAYLNCEVGKAGSALKEKLVEKLLQKHREKGANAVTDSDTRRWLLPNTHPTLVRTIAAKKPLKGITPKQVESYRAAIPKDGWREWETPFDTDPDWPKPLQDALTAFRAAWRAKVDEVNACIAASAVMEELVDKPEPVKGVVRVSGPFSIEGVISLEEGPDTPIDGAPEDLETFDGETAVKNAEAHLDTIIRLLKVSGVDFPGNKNMVFSRLDPLTGTSLIHAEGEWMNGDKKERRAAVSVGPEVGNVSSMQVEDVIRDANRKGYDDVVFAGFGFDAAAQDAIESGNHPKLRLHMALIRPDVAMGDLLKTQPGSQLFTVFSAPRVKGPTKQADGEFIIEVEGMDVYDPVSNTLFPTDKERIAAWFLDTDYDGRTFCICQAFFPDKSKWDKLAKALGDADVIEEDAFEALSGLKSLPFPRPERLGKGEAWRVAVKIIDPRGNDGLRVLTIN